jgi:hypothetical protein
VNKIRIAVIKICRLLLTLVVVTFGFLTLMTTSAVGLVDPDTAIKITDASFDCGQTGTSQILVSIVNNPSKPRLVHGVEVHLSFDPTKLQVVDADGDPANGVQIAPEGGLFPLGSQIVVQHVDNVAGTILFAVGYGSGVQDATDAAIATITWESAVDCATMMEEACLEVSIMNALMSDADGYPITVNNQVFGTVCCHEERGCITGSIQIQGRDDYSGATVKVKKDGGVVASALTDADGNFRLEDLPPDTYEVYAKTYGYLDSLTSNVVVVAGEVCTDTDATKLLGGDVVLQPKPDNKIDILDVSYIGAHFWAAEATADVNGDGVVNIRDLVMAAANFGRTGPTTWSMMP